jgi:hypothetical protein
LDDKINSPAGRIGFLFAQYILLAQNGDIIFDDEFTPAIPIGNDGAAENHPFMGF